MREVIVRVYVDFPALSAIAEWLQGTQQKQIDKLAAQVGALTSSLEKSRSGLQGSVDHNK